VHQALRQYIFEHINEQIIDILDYIMYKYCYTGYRWGHLGTRLSTLHTNNMVLNVHIEPQVCSTADLWLYVNIQDHIISMQCR
jgi:hypothetical protein